ncbi:hypothetical protein O7635_07755 [Asanoa sp. WMMD1127]|uniref:hypothetical protein n=1 Tax=Asanoa sp. WMMD1127 TaxID=3016107 RepID=UPI002417865C|nr:hypothetical protein [Asanoa sp. WMMD1127]MDG4821747.1 hypothetical protein [Asanoa sp. WMMD1127]
MTSDGSPVWVARRARLAISATIIATLACVAGVVAVPRPADALVAIGLYVPSIIGVLLLWRTSVYSWRDGARQPRSFTVHRDAFLLLPARATTRAVALVLASAFPAGHLIMRMRVGALDALDWAIAAVGALVIGLATLHSVFLWRGAPRPLVIVTPSGVTAAGFFGSVHAPWTAFRSVYASWPDRRMNLALPVYGGRSVSRRGLRPHGVKLPDTSEPFAIPAAWSTNPWWAAQALATYWRGIRDRSAIGTPAEHTTLARTLDRFDHEIDEQLSQFQ